MYIKKNRIIVDNQQKSIYTYIYKSNKNIKKQYGKKYIIRNW